MCAGKAKLLPSGFLFLKNAFIYLAEPSLSCGMWDLLLDQGFNLGALHCVCGVLAPGPPGMSPVSFSPRNATWPSCCCFHPTLSQFSPLPYGWGLLFGRAPAMLDGFRWHRAPSTRLGQELQLFPTQGGRTFLCPRSFNQLTS